MLTTRADRSAIINSDSSDCSIIKTFAHLAGTGASVGEKAGCVESQINEITSPVVLLPSEPLCSVSSPERGRLSQNVLDAYSVDTVRRRPVANTTKQKAKCS